mgnify:CR=1 FL=1
MAQSVRDVASSGEAQAFEATRTSRSMDSDIVEGVTGDPLEPDWNGPRYRGAASLTFRPSEFSRLRLQANADYLKWQPQPIYGAFIALETTVGAHGAHAF